MAPLPANPDSKQRRAIKRTAWIVAIVALALYLLFFLTQGLSH
ncbi:MAG: hypothetical protein ACREPN_02195 [Rudaea sp.]